MWHGTSIEFQMVPGCHCFTVTVAISELSIHKRPRHWVLREEVCSKGGRT
jgi:hypothetical protein